MNDRHTGSGRTRGGSGDDLEARAQNAKSGAATLVYALGLIIALGSAVATIFAGVRADVISGGAVGIALGILGCSLGAGRLGVATIVISVLAMFAGLLQPGYPRRGRRRPRDSRQGAEIQRGLRPSVKAYPAS